MTVHMDNLHKDKGLPVSDSDNLLIDPQSFNDEIKTAKALSAAFAPPKTTNSTSITRANQGSKTNNNGPANTLTRAATPTDMVTVITRTLATRVMMTATAAITGLLFTRPKEKTPGGTADTKDSATAEGPQTDSRRVHPSTCICLARTFTGSGDRGHHQGWLQDTLHQGPSNSTLPQTRSNLGEGGHGHP